MRQASDGFTYSDLGINENNLFKYIEEIDNDVYFDEFDTFTAGSGERFLKPYQLAVKLGEFLKENAQAFTVDAERGPVFEDQTLANRYEQIKVELQAALSE